MRPQPRQLAVILEPQDSPATVNFIGRQDLIANKRTAGRPQDLDDARELERGENGA